MAILFDEDAAQRCADCLIAADGVLISAGTLAESLIVAERRGLKGAVIDLVDGLAMQVVPVAQSMAKDTAMAYTHWGKGRHPASLNFGDCFAYALAHARQVPLLYVGGDFAKTDITQALLVE